MKTRKTLTVDLIMLFNPACWTRKQIAQQFGGRKRCSVFDVLTCEAVKPVDKFWLLLRSEFLSDKHKRLFACDCAARALRRKSKAGRKPDSRSYAAVQVARRFAVGKATASELTIAWTAAWSAAETTAWSTARSAARSAEQNWQLNRLKFYLKKEHEQSQCLR